MPPFLNTRCTNCSKPNRFDLAELRKEDGSVVFKGKSRSINELEEEEFAVTCQHCGRKFKFTLKGGDDGKKK